MTKQRREGEADGPQGQRPARVSRRGPSWTEFVRLADQAVVAFAGTDMINHAEPRACGHSRGSRRLDTEPETERTAGSASNAAGDGCGRAQDDQAGFQPYWCKRRSKSAAGGGPIVRHLEAVNWFRGEWSRSIQRALDCEVKRAGGRAASLQ